MYITSEDNTLLYLLSHGLRVEMGNICSTDDEISCSYILFVGQPHEKKINYKTGM
jgi:hypothetical protein